MIQRALKVEMNVLTILLEIVDVQQEYLVQTAMNVKMIFAIHLVLAPIPTVHLNVNVILVSLVTVLFAMILMNVFSILATRTPLVKTPSDLTSVLATLDTVVLVSLEVVSTSTNVK